MLDQCLLAPNSKTLRDVGEMLDTILSTLISSSPHLRPRLRRHADVMQAFTRLWLADIERVQLTLSLPPLVFLEFLPVDLFVRMAGGTTSDIAHICVSYMRHLDACFLRDPTRLGPGALTGMARLLWALVQRAEDFLKYAVLYGILPVLVELAWELTELTLSDYEEGAEDLKVPETVTAVNVFMYTVTNALSLGPQYIIEALDADIIYNMLSFSVFWKLTPDQAEPQALKELSHLVESCLETIKQNAYDLRVWRHIRRNKYAYLPDHVESAFFYEKWKQVYGRLEMCDKLHDNYMRVGPFSCANEKCPRQRDPNRNHIRLKECTRCFSQVVCSRNCQRKQWPQHREMCDSVVRSFRNDILRSPLIISRDTTAYYEYLIQTLIVRAGCDAVYKKNRSKLSRPRGGGAPTHAMRLAIDKDPMPLYVEPLSKFSEDDKATGGLDMYISQMKHWPMKGMDCIIACAEFAHGYSKTVIFTIGEVQMR